MLKKLLGLFAAALLPMAGSADERGCQSVAREHFVDGWKTADAVRVIQAPITPGAVIACRYYPDDRHELNVLVRYETGVFDGARYRLFHADGSATIQGRRDASLGNGDTGVHWSLRCRTHDGGEPLSCDVKKADLVITRSVDASTTITLGEVRAEDSDLLIRVDAHTAITAAAGRGFSPQQVARIMQQLRSGESVDTRFYPPEQRHSRYRTLSLFGFNQALDIAARVMQQARRIGGPVD